MHPVIIVGGGPAGAACACYLAKAGIDCIVFDGAVHPRAHVGESLVPSTTRVFREIGFLATMEREGFVKKYGAAWHPPARSGMLSIAFAEFPQPGVEQPHTYHVDRARFDALLLKHAETTGARVVQGVRVKRVHFDDGRAVGVAIDVAGRSIDIDASLVVDASGRRTLVGRQLGWKRSDPLFNQFAVHNWFDGVDRGAGDTADYIHIHFLPVRRGWVWQIPITETVTSIGVVAEKDVFKSSAKDHTAWFHEMVSSTPDIARAMRSARPLRAFDVEADYSYCMDRFVADGVVLVGDAARFVDPIFSSGVSVALYSAKFAAEVIVPALRCGDVRASVLEPYERRLRRGTAIWYEFIRLYYKLLPLFTRFITTEDYRHQVLQLLQGDVYDRDEVPVLDAMRSYIDSVERTRGHFLEPALDPDIAVGEPAVARS